jgi:hypothetical protein
MAADTLSWSNDEVKAQRRSSVDAAALHQFVAAVRELPARLSIEQSYTPLPEERPALDTFVETWRQLPPQLQHYVAGLAGRHRCAAHL